MLITWSKRIWLVLATVLLLPASASAFSTMYVLGDSLSDTGNLLAETGSLPQPPYFAGRFSNGPVYAEYLWKSLGLKDELLASSSPGGTDYAVGGARSRYHSFDGSYPAFNPVGGSSSFFSYSLLGQRDALLADKASVLDGQALYTVWEGSNDVSDAITLWLKASATAAIDLIKQAVGDFVAVVMSLVGAGAQHLLIPNVPNLGLVPEVVALGAGAQGLATQLTLLYNDLVGQALAGIAADISRLDTFYYLGDMVAHPSAYGLPADAKVSTACFSGYVGVPGTVCDDPQNYVFWDGIHPSAVVHAELGRLAATAVPEPATLLLIALALLALGYMRLRLAAAAEGAAD